MNPETRSTSFTQMRGKMRPLEYIYPEAEKKECSFFHLVLHQQMKMFKNYQIILGPKVTLKKTFYCIAKISYCKDNPLRNQSRYCHRLRLDQEIVGLGSRFHYYLGVRWSISYSRSKPIILNPASSYRYLHLSSVKSTLLNRDHGNVSKLRLDASSRSKIIQPQKHSKYQ
ncbi:hypothetical protein BDC45DRAFT_555785 [Circinella umbellata]|nr:hypothetical protein BDC45DRAFT_555785 [Circinella umbellata]